MHSPYRPPPPTEFADRGLIGGEAHLLLVAAEASELGAEYGCAVAAYKIRTTLGPSVYD